VAWRVGSFQGMCSLLSASTSCSVSNPLESNRGRYGCACLAHSGRMDSSNCPSLSPHRILPLHVCGSERSCLPWACEDLGGEQQGIGERLRMGCRRLLCRLTFSPLFLAADDSRRVVLLGFTAGCSLYRCWTRLAMLLTGTCLAGIPRRFDRIPGTAPGLPQPQAVRRSAVTQSAYPAGI
jgi:hypothetical protein